MFVDVVTMHLRAGAGGAGVVSFRAVRGRPKRKPEGGSGGRGGDVVIRASSGVSTLLRYQRHPHHAAGNGTHGGGDLQHGRQGGDLVLDVPCGTLVRDDRGVLVADLVEDGQQVVVLEGGRGGRGNAALVTPRLRAPGFAEQGEYGPAAAFTFELKLVADVAIVGFPNAGKSTLISAVSAARPTIADYPFTTLRPHLGVVAIDDREFVMADIPGLIEGASAGRGLGKEFLRHAERARVLLVLLDPLSDRSLADQHAVLVDELGRYDPSLAERLRVLAVSKIDVADPRDEVVRLETELDATVYPISAVRGDGLGPLLGRLADAVGSAQRAEVERPGFLLHRPAEEGFEVGREGGTWVVRGRTAERAVALSDLTVPAAAATAARRLARLGVEDALRAAGARSGDPVRIGDLIFEFQEDPQEPG